MHGLRECHKARHCVNSKALMPLQDASSSIEDTHRCPGDHRGSNDSRLAARLARMGSVSGNRERPTSKGDAKSSSSYSIDIRDRDKKEANVINAAQGYSCDEQTDTTEAGRAAGGEASAKTVRGDMAMGFEPLVASEGDSTRRGGNPSLGSPHGDSSATSLHPRGSRSDSHEISRSHSHSHRRTAALGSSHGRTHGLQIIVGQPDDVSSSLAALINDGADEGDAATLDKVPFCGCIPLFIN